MRCLRGADRFFWSEDECQAILVHWCPVGSMGAESKVLLVACSVHEQDASVASSLNAQIPDGVFDPCAQIPTKVPGATSSNQRVSSPRRPTGTADVEMTTNMLATQLVVLPSRDCTGLVVP